MRSPDGADAPALIRHDIDGRLTLAGQPQPQDWPQLAAEGFQVIINVRSDPERAAAQRRSAAAAGFQQYVHLPLPAYELEREHLAAFHQALQAAPGRVLLHCRSATRVALLWVLERVTYGGWSRAQAEQALRATGYGDDTIETCAFCADDFFERAAATPSGSAV